ncbi:MAG TPA: tripartite tricarboxylate transporter substrate binding protein [Ramlibacter sp.]|nr:tripartite tricarboxylate transporter substrate binding protein [Ramlibacter sp.]
MTCFQSNTPRRAALTTLLAAMAIAGAPGAQAQQFPSKPIRIVVTAPAGGTSDIVARTLGEGLAPLLGQPVIIDNKPGGAGMIGTQDLLSAPHDGYTLMVGPNALVTEVPHVVKLRIDPFKELKPLAELTRSGLVMVGGAAVPATNFKDVIAFVKARPGKISYASYTTGTISHTMGLELNKAAGLDMTHVGYKGSPPALTDVMGGHVALMFDGPATSIPMIKAGKLKAFAVSSPKRMAALPDVPTFAELGYPQINGVGWIGLWATPDVPADVQARVREATHKVLQQPRVIERFAELGQDVGQPQSAEELAKSLRTASDKQAALLKSIGFQAE